MRWAVALVLVTCTVLLLASNLRARDMPRRLRILVPSDMHDDLASVNRLKSAVADVDLVVCPGDLTSMPNLRLDSSAAELRTYEERSTRVLMALSVLARRVVFVPGNHDLPLITHAPRSAAQRRA